MEPKNYMGKKKEPIYKGAKKKLENLKTIVCGKKSEWKIKGYFILFLKKIK